MKYLFLSLILSSAVSIASVDSENIKTAVEQLSQCGNFLRADDQYLYSGFGSYFTGNQADREPKQGSVRFVSFAQHKENVISTHDSAVDLLTYSKLTYILTYSGIEEWDMATLQRRRFFKTQPAGVRLGDEEHSRAFARYQDKVIVAHGRLGVSFVNLTTKRVTSTLPLITSQGELESMAQGVSVSGKYAYVVLDSYTLVEAHQKPPFRGIVVIDMETERIVKEIGDLPPGVDSITSDSKSLILSFYGNPLWKYAIPTVLTSNKIQPTARVFKFPLTGSPYGKALIDDKYYYTCFSQLPGQGQGSLFIKTKAVLNRNQLMLN